MKFQFDFQKIKRFFYTLTREQRLLWFFIFLFSIIFLRLFYLQVVESKYYSDVLIWQHYTQSLLKAKRGDIYAVDKSWNKVKLTTSTDLYTLYVDPKFVNDKAKLIQVLTPLVYEHFCVNFALATPDKFECVRNIEKFSGKTIFQQKESALFTSWENNLLLDFEAINNQNIQIAESFSWEIAAGYIKDKLNDLIVGGYREKNYLGFYDDPALLDDLKTVGPAVEVVKNYVYLIPKNVTNVSQLAHSVKDAFARHGSNIDLDVVEGNLYAKEIRYVKLLDDVHSSIAQKLKQLKSDYYNEKIEGIPLLHGLGLEKYDKRYYPYWSFMSHVLWYYDDKKQQAFYGVEEFFDWLLRWKDGKMIWLSVPWIWAIWSNDFNIENPVDGSDVYLSLDVSMQREVESVADYYFKEIRPDSLSVLVMDPDTWSIKSAVNYPNFDPNFYADAYKIKPLEYLDRKYIDDDTYVDIPVLYASWDKLFSATYDQRKDESLTKYIFKNVLGPQVFKDKNISFPYEPWSIFKAFTLAIGIDSDSISMFDFYLDNWKIEVGPYEISNVQKQCLWTHPYVHALERSCNVGMVRIWEAIKRYVYYNYLEKVGFGKNTWVELAWEDAWKISALEDFSLARFYNNTFWQWLLVTPIQIAVWYSALVNGWYLVKPTVIWSIVDHQTKEEIKMETKVKKRIFREETSAKLREALGRVVQIWDSIWMQIEDYQMWWKSWTSQIAFKWQYQGWNGWTNSSFVWIVGLTHTKYVIVVQVRRPRSCQWWGCTAWAIFKDISKFLIEYEGIKETNS